MKKPTTAVLFVIFISTGLLLGGCGKASVEDETLDAFMKCASYRNQVAKIIDSGYETLVSRSDAEKIREYHKKALAEARKVDVDVLNKKYPDWGTQFKNNCLAGLDMIVKGDEQTDAPLSVEGQMRLRTWSNWFNAHLKDIRNL